MATPDVEMHGSDSDSALSEPLGTDTLEARSMVPSAYRNTPDAEEVRTWVWVNGRQFLKVDHAANIRMNSPVSKIWQHGTEHRLAGDLGEKYWRCNHWLDRC